MNEDRREQSESKISPLLEDQTVVTYMTVPPDGGWGWVIVAVSFCINILTDGIINTTGLFIGRIDESLKVSKASVALIGSLLAGCSQISGPFVSALTNRYGFRTVAILGSIVACAALLLSSIGGSIEFLWISYGIIGGIGFGMLYMPVVIIIGFYFERWRSLATGIAVCGSGIGTFLFPPIISFFFDYYGWRSTLIIQAAIVLNCAVFCSLLRPLKPVKVTVPRSGESEDEANEEENKDTMTSNKQQLLMKIKSAREDLKRTDSKLSFDNEVSITAQPLRHLKRYFKAGHNNKYATVHDVLNNSYKPVQNIFQKSIHSIDESNELISNKGRFDIIRHITKKDNSQTSVNETKANDSFEIPLASKYLKRRSSTHKGATVAAIIETSDIRRNSINLRYHPRSDIHSDGIPRRLKNRRATISSGVRPLYREDIFLQGSLSRLPQYSSKGSGLEYTLAVTHLPTFNDVMEEETLECTCCPEAVQRTLATMLDMSLLSSPSFMLLCFGGFFTCMGFYVPFMFIESRANEAGLDIGKWLISTIGISNTIGRIACGIIASLPRVNALLINNIAMCVAGLATMISGLSMTIAYQFVYAAVFGFSLAAFSSLRTVITVDLIGLEKLTNGFGLIILFQGVAAIIGAPIAGVIMDMYQDHNINFILAGGLILLSGLMCLPLNWISQWEKQRNSSAKPVGQIV